MRRPAPRGLLLGAVLPILLAAAAWAQVKITVADSDAAADPLQGQISKNSTELDRLRGEIKQQKGRIVSLDNEAAAVRRSHDEILRDIELSREFLGGMDERERLLIARSETLQVDLEAAGRAFRGRQAALAKSLRSMYVRGQKRDLELILMSGSFSEFLARKKWDAQLVRLGAGLVETTYAEGTRIRSEKRQQDVALAEIALAREEARNERERLELLEAEQVAALRELEEEKKGVKNRMLDLSLNEQRLNYILSDLEQQRTEAEALAESGDQTVTGGLPLATLAGELEWPVRGDLIRGFGRSVHPRFKTVTLNNGFNIGAAEGAPVAAVAAGNVEFSDDLPGFGPCVILDHGAGYYTLYAYLDRVFVNVGSEIARGQVIAEVGRPAGGEPPQLYFEVRHGRTPLDPADWLRSR